MAFQKMEPTPTPTRSLAEARSLCVPVENIYITLSFLQCPRERGRERERGRAVVCVRAWMVANDSEECRKVGCRHCHRRCSFTLPEPDPVPPPPARCRFHGEPTNNISSESERTNAHDHEREGHSRQQCCDERVQTGRPAHRLLCIWHSIELKAL